MQSQRVSKCTATSESMTTLAISHQGIGDYTKCITPEMGDYANCIRIVSWSKIYRYRGLIAAFVAACLSSIVTILVSLAHGTSDASQLVFTRGLLSSVFSSALLIGLGVQLTPTSRDEVKGLLLQGILSYVSLWSLYYAYQNMSPGDAATIFYGYIAFSAIFGRILLKEPLGCFEGIMLFITLAGVILIIRPPFLFGSQGSVETTTKLLPALCALFSSLCSACMTVALRALGKQNTNPIKSVMYCALFQLVLSSASITITGSWSISACVRQRLEIVAFAILAFLALSLFVYALSLENIALVTVITVNEVYLVFCVETFFLGRNPNLLSIIGMVMIVSSSLVISGKKVMQMRKQLDHKINDKDVKKVDSDAENHDDIMEEDVGENDSLELRRGQRSLKESSV